MNTDVAYAVVCGAVTWVTYFLWAVLTGRRTRRNAFLASWLPGFGGYMVYALFFV